METVQIVLRVLIALIFLAMGVNHFRPRAARGMAAMVPPQLARGRFLTRKNLVRFTGACEIAGGIGILLPWTTFAAGVALIVFLIAVFPANVYAAARPDQFGRAAIPFWPRYVAQVVLVAVIAIAAMPLD